MAKRILVAAVFVPLLFVIILLAPPIAWTAVVCVISAVAAFELLRAAGGEAVTPSMKAAAILAAVLIPLGSWLDQWLEAVNLCALGVMAVSFLCAIRDYDGEKHTIGLFHVLVALFGGVLIPQALSALVELGRMEHGRYLVLLAVLLAFVTDAGAYFAGVFLGKHRGVSKVSPNKSVEGYIGGFVTGVVFTLLYGLIVGAVRDLETGYLALALCGLFGSLATEAGDLAFSFIKREFKIKDFGNLLPGHGGMLDRFDSMIFCGPVVLFIVQWLPAFGAAAA